MENWSKSQFQNWLAGAEIYRKSDEGEKDLSQLFDFDGKIAYSIDEENFQKKGNNLLYQLCYQRIQELKSGLINFSSITLIRFLFFFVFVYVFVFFLFFFLKNMF